MKPRLWTVLDPETPLRQVVPGNLLIFTEDASELLELDWTSSGGIEVTNKLRHPFYRTPAVLPGDRVADLAELQLGAHAQIMLVPAVRIRRAYQVLHTVLWILSGLATFAVVVALDSWLAFAVWVPVAFLGLPLLAMAPLNPVRAIHDFTGQAAQELGVTPANVHEYALAVAHGDLWRGALPAGAPVPPRLQVDRIGHEYGRLRTDLVYRIEHPALFDPEVPTTAAFERALAEFDDLPEEAQEAQAMRIEVAFTVARQHAERVTIRHVSPEQRDAVRRAAKAARLAADAASPGERAAALASLSRIFADVDAPLPIPPDEFDELTGQRPPSR